ncbi:hypothetical protein NDU88_006108 [Pleurodeles waltl]|uniref:KRAB domain-containing protein n=1 Tax=Pleurodeles waltl TaxID=8319 RepID=A0AAV7QH04_PLEWA|nr:hypothetical protein NDU88_006108 [Pleurodeles waltl]
MVLRGHGRENSHRRRIIGPGEEEREWWRPDSLEEVSWTEKEWNATSGAGGGTESHEPLGYGDPIDEGGVSEVCKELVVESKTHEETPKKSKQRRHVPGGAWLAQTQAAYHDVSAYFSEEEWSILQQWQEELHQNVMKEIDHALTSLGPVIATMVFSLRAKAEAEPCLMEDQRSERRRSSHTLPSCMIMNPDTLLRRTKNENLHLNGPLDTNDIGKKDCLSTEEQQTSIYIDDFGEEIGENSTDSHSGHDIISFYIKEEGETYYIDTHDHKQKESTYNSTVTGHDIISFCINEDETYFVDKQDSKNMETTRTSTDVGSETRKIKAGHLIAYTEKITGNVLHEEGERSMHQSPKKGANTKVQVAFAIEGNAYNDLLTNESSHKYPIFTWQRLMTSQTGSRVAAGYKSTGEL